MAGLTGAFSGVWSGLLPGTLTMQFGVTVTGSGIAAPITLEVISGTLTRSEDSTPHVDFTAQCRVPDDQAVLDALDARLERRVVITGGYRVPGLAESHTLADLMLFSRVVTRADGTAQMTIRAVSDEQRVIDFRPVSGSRTYYEGSDGGQAIADLIKWAVSGATVDVQASGIFVATGETLVIDREDDIWNSIQDIADRIGAWVYHDGLGTFHVVPQPVNADAAVAALKVGPGGTITSSESAVSREGFANTVLVEFSWYDGESQSAWGTAQATSGPYSVSAIGTAARTLRIERKGTAAQAKAAAASMLTRTITRGRSTSLEFEHAPLWLLAGSTVTVQLPTGPQERHLVSRFDLDIPSGHGHVTTRLPENISITTGE